MSIQKEKIFSDVAAEVARARELFPSNKHMLHAFQEEAGEVTREFLELYNGKGSNAQIYKELIQTMAMAVRLIQEGDPDLPYEPEKGCHYPGCDSPFKNKPCALCYD